MLIVKGVLVVLGSIGWFTVFPFILIVETVRYGLELTMDSLARVWAQWEVWRNA